ncbi:hypothetical protein KIW84_031528 [Lathyrus oleraceus]|uniref:Uncharacterized protein n=1 Tax=Pisum sativum TaxID=3888 RepID=A0A9D5AXK0_PEA|nr:hypothetical protein KIW84_031528 [Pisum sativum]
MASSIGGPNMNMSEALRANNISTPQARPNQQASPGAGIAIGPSLPQHLLCIHAIGILAVLPQYKNNISVSSLPYSAAIPPGYGFGSSTSIPGGNYSLNPSGAPTSATSGYDDVMSFLLKITMQSIDT